MSAPAERKDLQATKRMKGVMGKYFTELTEGLHELLVVKWSTYVADGEDTTYVPLYQSEMELTLPVECSTPTELEVRLTPEGGGGASDAHAAKPRGAA